MDYTTLLPVILAAVFAVNQALKTAGMPSRYAPLVNIIGGAIAGALAMMGGDYIVGIVGGITAGLGAGGVYSGAKKIKEVNRLKNYK